MNENDITVSLTESQHELLRDLLNHAIDSVDVIFPYGIRDLPDNHEIAQRYDMLYNLKETFDELWVDRFIS